MSLRLSPPQPLLPVHQFDAFECGEPLLDDWLKRRANANQLSGARRTFVAIDRDQHICGYYALAAGAVTHQIATSTVRRNMPDPIPVMVPARLAVDRAAVSHNTGVRALLVHALHDRANQFCAHYGFQVSPTQALTLMLRLGNLAA